MWSQLEQLPLLLDHARAAMTEAGPPASGRLSFAQLVYNAIIGGDLVQLELLAKTLLKDPPRSDAELQTAHPTLPAMLAFAREQLDGLAAALNEGLRRPA